MSEMIGCVIVNLRAFRFKNSSFSPMLDADSIVIWFGLGRIDGGGGPGAGR